VQPLYEKFVAIMGEGDEAKAKEFLTSHFNEFPKKVREEIMLGFFEEALQDRAKDDSALAEFESQSVKAAQTLERTKSALEKGAKLADLKGDIKG